MELEVRSPERFERSAINQLEARSQDRHSKFVSAGHIREYTYYGVI